MPRAIAEAVDGLVILQREAAQEMLGQRQNVAAPQAQGRHLRVHHVEPIIQILAELPAATSWARSRLVAATMRTSTLIDSLPPTRSKRRSCRPSAA
jgi:hypothetical protein